ncbi:hypothetical protein IB276_26390 [Ensifer sp. ENS04]|uniref:hypothetical protein n=1 Tax=Ensifer sp. ENS04 TaxID=2769281 RepID=UPI0017802AC4|nr:hypothetical protein [Ensifer sp. ENS04]MBD9542979.1 hypothetical protein [Ensifer sp. ENS04]
MTKKAKAIAAMSVAVLSFISAALMAGEPVVAVVIFGVSSLFVGAILADAAAMEGKQ